jgi:peptide-methionine (S)-S-oxide reductase
LSQVQGVTVVQSGYSNGHVIAAELRAGVHRYHRPQRGCQAGVRPAQISLGEILQVFFLIHDPTTLNRQGNDTGTQYRSGIYFTTPEQQAEAQAMIESINRDKLFGRPAVTEVLPLANYSAAEDYHQDFFEKNPYQGYCMAVAAPKVEKFRKTFARLVKA